MKFKIITQRVSKENTGTKEANDRERAAYQRIIKHRQGQPTAYVAALYFLSTSVTVGRLELVSVYAKLSQVDREKEREGQRRRGAALIIYVKIAPEPLFLTLFFIVPFFKCERTDGEHAKERERDDGLQVVPTDSPLSLAFCVDSKKYYNLCLAGREKYNSLFRRVYKENDNGVPRMGESRPPPREEKGLETARGVVS